MQFQLLGPLEVRQDDRSIPLGGLRQRALLAYMLLRPNQVVPTSQLLHALWPGDDAPETARKMLQNAAWGIRTAFTSAGCESVKLVTRPPGYLLEVDSSSIDLHKFRVLSEEGRTHLTASMPEKAASLLGWALAMWRGEPLSDLTERGICWPEITTLEQARRNTLESYFDAQLASGRHQEILVELEELVERERFRERFCGQLMLALYRSGRHADALAAYGRMRTALVEELGLEPSPVLQRLQQSILNHDPTLLLDPRPVTDVHSSDRASESPPETLSPAPDDSPRPDRPKTRSATAERTTRQLVTLVLIQVSAERSGAADPTATDQALRTATATMQSALTHLGASIVGSIGSLTLASFAADSDEQDDAQAVRAVLVMRDALSSNTVANRDDDSIRIAISAAMVTGEATIEQPTTYDGSPSAHGSLVETCLALHSRVGLGEVWACHKTYQLNKRSVIGRYASESPIPAWSVAGVREPQAYDVSACGTSHMPQVSIIESMLDLASTRQRPHLVSVIGDRRESTHAFVQTLEYRLQAMDGLRVIRFNAACPGERSLALLTEFTGSGLLPPKAPTVLILEHVDEAEEEILNGVEQLVNNDRSTPVLLVITARTILLSLRPHWIAGRPYTASMTIESAFDRAVAELRSAVSRPQPKRAAPTVPALSPAPAVDLKPMATLYVAATPQLPQPRATTE